MGAVDLATASSHSNLNLQLKLKTTKEPSAGGKEGDSKGKEKMGFEADELRWVLWKDRRSLLVEITVYGVRIPAVGEGDSLA